MEELKKGEYRKVFEIENAILWQAGVGDQNAVLVLQRSEKFSVLCVGKDRDPESTLDPASEEVMMLLRDEKMGWPWNSLLANESEAENELEACPSWIAFACSYNFPGENARFRAVLDFNMEIYSYFRKEYERFFVESQKVAFNKEEASRLRKNAKKANLRVAAASSHLDKLIWGWEYDKRNGY